MPRLRFFVDPLSGSFDYFDELPDAHTVSFAVKSKVVPRVGDNVFHPFDAWYPNALTVNKVSWQFNVPIDFDTGKQIEDGDVHGVDIYCS